MNNISVNFNKDRKKKGKLGGKILAVAMVPMVMMAIAVAIVSTISMQNAMKAEMMSSITVSANAMNVLYNSINDDSFSVDSSGKLSKGSYCVSDNLQVLDDFVAGNDLEVTIFFGDTRRATTLIDHKTGERIIGTQADQKVVEQVVNQGKIYETYDITVNEEHFYACYVPLKNPDGTIVGMSFAGCPVAEVNATINEKTRNIIIIEVVVMIIAVVLIVFMSKTISKAIAETEKAVEGVSNGDLTTQIDAKAIRRNDELGDMAKGVAILLQQLIEVVQNIKKSSAVLLKAGDELKSMSEQTSSTADEIGRAVEDISRGAVSQSEEIETASMEIDAMGQLISKIVDNVAQLSAGTVQIKSASDQSVEIIQQLSRSNDRSMDAIDRIAQQVNATNDSAMKISSAVDLITSIAEETNLLSLNASIEAARAGEQGRGFAVVAGQIQKLAEQSNDSARTIADIISNLLKDSEQTVQVMNEVQDIMNEQQLKLNETKKQFDVVGDGIGAANTAAGVIKEQTETCDVARAKVVDVISNLSAISEENAASTEETTASMQELNATINLLAESAGQLEALARGLEENMAFFNLDESFMDAYDTEGMEA